MRSLRLLTFVLASSMPIFTAACAATTEDPSESQSGRVSTTDRSQVKSLTQLKYDGKSLEFAYRVSGSSANHEASVEVRVDASDRQHPKAIVDVFNKVKVQSGFESLDTVESKVDLRPLVVSAMKKALVGQAAASIEKGIYEVVLPAVESSQPHLDPLDPAAIPPECKGAKREAAPVGALSTLEYNPGLGTIFPGDPVPAALAAEPRSFNFSHADGKPHQSEVDVAVSIDNQDRRTIVVGEVRVFALKQSNASCKRSPEFVDVRDRAIAGVEALKAARAGDANIQSTLRFPGSTILQLRLPNVLSGPAKP